MDIYYYDENRIELKPDSNFRITKCFRVRKKDDKSYITYKDDVFDTNGIWLYSNEEETEIIDYNVIRNIIKKLGFKKLVTVDMVKYFFETSDYNIAIEDVKKLGYFLEVESKNRSCSDVISEKKKIQSFLSSLNIKLSDEVNSGKPELLLKKLGIEE